MSSKIITSDNFPVAKTLDKEMCQLIVKMQEMCQLLAIEQLLMLKKRTLHTEGSFPSTYKKISNSKKIDYFLGFEDKPYKNSLAPEAGDSQEKWIFLISHMEAKPDVHGQIFAKSSLHKILGSALSHETSWSP